MLSPPSILASIALLFDVDGTLIDIGPVAVRSECPRRLCRSLARLYERMDGALALVSGRPIRDIDKLFSPLKLPAIGGHGAEMRLADGKVIAGVKALPDKLRKRLALAATPGSGVVLEDKGYSFALHYRQTPQQEPRLRALVERVRADFPGEALEVLLGKAMFEVKRPGVSKGDAVRALMTNAPFAGRMPVFLGDDVTDELVFNMLPALRGKGYSVGRRFEELAGIFAAPRDVREACAASRRGRRSGCGSSRPNTTHCELLPSSTLVPHAVACIGGRIDLHFACEASRGVSACLIDALESGDGRFSKGKFEPQGKVFETPPGRALLARLVVVSNRVAVPDEKARAGGLEVAVNAALKTSGGLWFGWSGRVTAKPSSQDGRARQHHLHHHRSPQRRLPGILQRLRQPRAVADPALPRRSGGVFAPRPQRLSARQRLFRPTAAPGAHGRTTSSGCTTIT